MYIVKLNNGVDHSAWSSKVEALEQIRVLKDHGYKNCYYQYLAGVECENSTYFV